MGACSVPPRATEAHGVSSTVGFAVSPADCVSMDKVGGTQKSCDGSILPVAGPVMAICRQSLPADDGVANRNPPLVLRVRPDRPSAVWAGTTVARARSSPAVRSVEPLHNIRSTRREMPVSAPAGMNVL
jgi:hypothetical protein